MIKNETKFTESSKIKGFGGFRRIESDHIFFFDKNIFYTFTKVKLREG